jgi:hypothetical protein
VSLPYATGRLHNSPEVFLQGHVLSPDVRAVRRSLLHVRAGAEQEFTPLTRYQKAAPVAGTVASTVWFPGTAEAQRTVTSVP